MRNRLFGRRAFLAICGLVVARAPGRGKTSAESKGDPWMQAELMEPDQLAERIKAKEKLTMLYVGFPVLYRAAHIPDATMAGPASKPEGLELLKEATQDLDRAKEVILYCGCCPLAQCPNIRPAYSALKERNFSNVRVVRIPTNLRTDWIEKGYPVSRPPIESQSKPDR